jgi:hypothetical protein
MVMAVAVSIKDQAYRRLVIMVKTLSSRSPFLPLPAMQAARKSTIVVLGASAFAVRRKAENTLQERRQIALKPESS